MGQLVRNRRLLLSLAVVVLAIAVGGLALAKTKKKAARDTKDKAAKPAQPIAVPADIAKQVELKQIAKGFDRPVALTFAPGDTTGRLYVVEQGGLIRILRGDKIDATPFADLSAIITRGGNEQGLLGLAFHPKFAENGRLFVNYTDVDGDTEVAEYRVGKKTKDQLDPASAKVLLMVKQPYSNHNGGNLAFGPDGKLYIGLGDGGAGGDPEGNGQNATALLGKMLRLDVDATSPKPEIRMMGLRNPWRYSFDRTTGDLYIGDVGQNLWEEVDVVSAADVGKGGQNFGWNVVEGLGHCYPAKVKQCTQTGMTAPVVEFGHDQGCSITGGYVYRGKAVPAIDGVYFYADYCTALVRSFRWKDGKVSDSWDWKTALDPKSKLAKLSSFGEDGEGELYLLSLDGVVYKFVARSGS